MRGNPGKRPLNGNEPTPRREMPEPPAHLSPAARAEWDRLAPQLFEMGTLTQVDRAVFALYCSAWGDEVEARTLENQSGQVNGFTIGKVVKGENGLGLSPTSNLSSMAFKRLKAVIPELGLSPSSRSRLHVPPAAPTDDYEKFLAAGPRIAPGTAKKRRA